MNSEKVMDLALRRGFLWQSNEIYGGTAGFWDLGPYGVRLKNKIVNLWRDVFVKDEGFYEIETPTIVPEIVFIASGHVKKFADPLVECKKCGENYRADHLIEEATGKNVEGLPPSDMDNLIREYDIRCPSCGGELSPVRMFNLMFVTSIGAARENRAYARPETAQGMFVSFNRVVRTMHPKLPFAIVQVGKAYRNEISPRQGLLRVREFDQMEAEIFVHPEEINNHPRYYLRENRKLRLYPANYQREGKDEILEITAGEAVRRGIIHNQFLAYYLHVATEFLRKLGIPDEAIRCRQQLEDERAHYSRDTWDVEVLTSYGWVEVAGHAYRTDYDLKSHMRISGRDLRYFVSYDKPQVKKIKKAVPDKKKIGQEFRERARDIMKMIEEKQQDILSGSDVRVDIDGKEIDLSEYVTVKEVEERVSGERIVPHVVEPSYGVGRILWCVLEHAYREEDDRVYLSLPPWLSPIDCAVLPLVSKDGMPERAMEIADMLKKRGLYVVYDESGSVGRRYARYDEIGVSFAVTVDSQTLSDNTVTVRERDSRKQVRVKIDELADKLRKLLSGEEDV